MEFVPAYKESSFLTGDKDVDPFDQVLDRISTKDPSMNGLYRISYKPEFNGITLNSADYGADSVLTVIIDTKLPV